MSNDVEQEGWASYAAEQDRHARLRDEVLRLAEVYAVAPGEPRCCSDCAANDIGDELRRLLCDA